MPFANRKIIVTLGTLLKIWQLPYFKWCLAFLPRKYGKPSLLSGLKIGKKYISIYLVRFFFLWCIRVITCSLFTILISHSIVSPFSMCITSASACGITIILEGPNLVTFVFIVKFLSPIFVFLLVCCFLSYLNIYIKILNKI